MKENERRKRHAKLEAFARTILESEEYREWLRQRAIAGTLPPDIEVMLWHLAYGEPPEYEP